MTAQTLPITVLIAAKNEFVNLPKCIESLRSMERIIVVDSQSTDGSIELIDDLGAECVQFSYSGEYPKKRQWALENLNITTPWTMLLDADEQVTEQLEAEIRAAIKQTPSHDAYLIKKGFHFMGRKMRFGGFSHSAVLLFKSGVGKFERIDVEETSGLDMEVHERVLIDGSIGQMKNALIHDDFKGLDAYIARHNRYSSWEAAIRLKLADENTDSEQIKPSIFGDLQEKRRFLKLFAMRTPCEPWAWFIYHYFIRLGFLEGRRGLIASQIRSQYISNVRAKVFERKQNSRS